MFYLIDPSLLVPQLLGPYKEPQDAVPSLLEARVYVVLAHRDEDILLVGKIMRLNDVAYFTYRTDEAERYGL